MINLTIRPLGRGRFAAFLGDLLICQSTTPLLSAARALKDAGVPPDTPITMTHEGSDVVSLKSTVEAAGLTVIENASEGPRFARYVPFPAVAGQRQRPFEAQGYSDPTQQENALNDDTRAIVREVV